MIDNINWSEKAKLQFFRCSDRQLIKNIKEYLIEMHRRNINLDDYSDSDADFEIHNPIYNLYKEATQAFIKRYLNQENSDE